MFARDIMTTDVATLSPEAFVVEAAALLVRHRISGAPVIDAGRRVVGIVSEGDLIRRAELGTEREWTGWREFLISRRTRAEAFIRSHAVRVQDIMTSPVWTVAESAPLGEIAELFEKKAIRRVPVLREGVLAGIVSRADMVRALLACWSAAHPQDGIDDEAIAKSILDHAEAERWIDTAGFKVQVRAGVVDLYGSTDSEESARALQVLAESMPGVRRVDNHLQARGFARLQHGV